MAFAVPVAEVIPQRGRGTGVGDGLRPLEWAGVERRLTGGGWCWLASVRPDGAPHVMPVLAAWSEPVVFVASKGTARKSRNLLADGRCVVTTDADGAHLVLEGTASRVRDRETLERASAAMSAVHGWPTAVAGDQLDADYGAPTSGGPPYGVFAIAPTTVFALPSGGGFEPTRWRFP